MPSFIPNRFNRLDDSELAGLRAVFELVSVVGADCLRDVARARVQKVSTRQPHPHYL